MSALVSRSASSAATINDEVFQVLAVTAPQIGRGPSDRADQISYAIQGSLARPENSVLHVRDDGPTDEIRSANSQLGRDAIHSVEEIIGEANGDLLIHGMRL